MIKHIPVLPKETIKYLAPSKNKNFIDATCGLGGHAKLILEKTAPGGRLLAIDWDAIAIEASKKNLKNYLRRVAFVNKSFSKLGLIIRQWNVSRIDGILFDLGVSTYQLKASERGFSFYAEATLDMRMSPLTQTLSAGKIINSWDEKDLRRLLSSYGEEPFAGRIARGIVESRQKKPIVMTNELVEVIKRVLPSKYRASRKKHFATSTFRALRMQVNDELKNLENGLKQALQILSPSGRLVVISFHSLEDRIVKNFFKASLNLEILTPKPITATSEEIAANPSARSAKLRAAVKIE